MASDLNCPRAVGPRTVGHQRKEAFMRMHLPRWIAAGLFLACGAGAAHAQTVKLTPLGQTAGELAAFDRAVLFEDPTGVRILYDPGPTVSAGDPRLGVRHVILVRHGHRLHLVATPQMLAPQNSVVLVWPGIRSFIG